MLIHFTVGVFFFPYKYISMILLIVQTTSTVLTMRISRTIDTEVGLKLYDRFSNEQTRYLNTTAVVMSEVFKVCC